ncbi:MAG: hypothetical protein ACRDTJ_16230 [Pseudonocardiaceae bacterium]
MSVTLDRLEALLSAEGLALLDRLSREEPAVADSIRLGSSLRGQFAPELVAAVLTQLELRRAAKGKFSKASQMLFTRPGLEQASAEVVSRYRAPRFAGLGRLADLCTGIGGDLISVAGQGETLAVDLDEVHLRMAVLNAEVYGVAAGVCGARRCAVGGSCRD